MGIFVKTKKSSDNIDKNKFIYQYWSIVVEGLNQ